MSWIEKIKTDFIIQTGDGKQFKPQWLNAAKTVEYNVAEFEFPNIAGTLVTRGTAKGTKYNLEIYFQGENHLDDSKDFELSANDPRAWIVTHPFYGRITVQPTSLSFDNTKYNVTEVKGVVIETLTVDYPKSQIDAKDKIKEDAGTTNSTFASSYSNNAKPKGADIEQMKTLNTINYTNASMFVDAANASDFINAYNSANSLLQNATDDPLSALSAMQKVIFAPANFALGVSKRIEILNGSLNTLRTSIAAAPTKTKKNLYQSTASTAITAMALSASTPDASDYQNKNNVLDVVEKILAAYNLYMVDLDSIQTETGGAPDSFIPDIEPILQLTALINYTLSNLFGIAMNAKQERSIVLEHDSNWIVLAHRFYGLDSLDANISMLIDQNGAGLFEILGIRKGRTIKYYV